MLRVFAIFLIIISVSCAGKKTKVSKKDAELADLHFRVGTGYLIGKNYPMALQELLIAEKLNPLSATIQNNLGLTYYARERKLLAMDKLKKAIKLNPKYSEARNNLARIHIERGNYSEAIKQLEIVNDDLLYPHPEKSWTNLAWAYFELKQYEATKSALQKAFALNRNYCPAFTLFGRTFYEQKRYESAASHLDKAAAVCAKSKFDEPNYYSALSYLQLGKKEMARARMNEVIANFPNGEFAEKAKSMLKLIQ